LASFGTYFLGFAVRPVGGIIFGVLGDRLGRKFVLLATILIMGTASTAIGLLPTYQTVGFWAPVLLTGLRLLQGVGAGAEQAGAAVLMAEYAPRERRGFFAALPFAGIMAKRKCRTRSKPLVRGGGQTHADLSRIRNQRSFPMSFDRDAAV